MLTIPWNPNMGNIAPRPMLLVTKMPPYNALASTVTIVMQYHLDFALLPNNFANALGKSDSDFMGF